MSFKSGFVAIIGRPNVGKSTFLNRVVGEKVSICSYKPQTTRNQIKGILTTDEYQIIFVDTPGMHNIKNRLDEYMELSIKKALEDVDIILYMTEVTKSVVNNTDIKAFEMIRNHKAKKFLLINKIDKVKSGSIMNSLLMFNKYKDIFDEIFPISCSDGRNINEVIDAIVKNLNEGPKYFDDDILTDYNDRFLIAEIIREKILFNLKDEVPHSISVYVDTLSKRENRELLDTMIYIYVERDSQKGILIGKKGEMLKKITSQARQELEEILGIQLNMQVSVKVKKNWKKNERFLIEIGYDAKKI